MEFINRNPIVYIFSGKARAGKDTSAAFVNNYYLKKNKKVVNLQYSAYLKEYAKKIVDWDGSDETKPRQLLIDLGTNLIRNKLDENFFINRMIEDIRVLSYFFDVITISDARIVGELEIPKKTFDNVKIVNIVRPNFDNGLTEAQKQTLTETSLNGYSGYDYTVINDGSIEDLEKSIVEIVEEIDA